MDVSNYHTYVVEGADQLAAIAENDRLYRERVAEARAWVKSLGGSSFLFCGEMDRMYGVVFDGGPPSDLWKATPEQSDVSKGSTVCRPSTRKKAGKELAKAMEGWRFPNAISAGAALGGDRFCMGPQVGGRGSGFRVLTTAVVKYGDTYVLLDPAWDESKRRPARELPGCRLIKMSEFYALKEAAEATPATA